ncbi:MAG: hypothetical protein AAGJ35_04805 [Myxococcota bacterium]
MSTQGGIAVSSVNNKLLPYRKQHSLSEVIDAFMGNCERQFGDQGPECARLAEFGETESFDEDTMAAWRAVQDAHFWIEADYEQRRHDAMRAGDPVFREPDPECRTCRGWGVVITPPAERKGRPPVLDTCACCTPIAAKFHQ